MPLKSRKTKSFYRLISRLKEAPIYIIDQYILIDESSCYDTKRRKGHDNRIVNLKEYENMKKQGSIKMPFDFDNIFNPDLTLSIPYEKNTKIADDLTQSLLYDIGIRWKERLEILFTDNEYTIVQYYDSDNLDWYLDFYNGKKRMEKTGESERIQNITYIS